MLPNASSPSPTSLTLLRDAPPSYTKLEKQADETSFCDSVEMGEPRASAAKMSGALASLTQPFAACCSHIFKKSRQGLKRDWEKFPSVQISKEAPSHIYALGDVHGDYDRALHLLEAHRVVTSGPDKVPHWSAGTAHLVQTGDLIDKGPKNLSTVDLFRRLQKEAHEAGGRVVVTMGNHEVDLLANPKNAKSVGPGGIAWEFWREGKSPKKATSPEDPRGLWWRQMPLAYVVRGFLFSHAGQTSGRSQSGLSDYLEYGLARDGYRSTVVKDENSIVRARNFYGSEKGEQGPRLARLAQVDTLAFGHDPQSLAPWGKIILFGEGSLVRLDTGLSRGVDYSRGELLQVSFDEKGKRALWACSSDGRRRKL